MFCSMCGGFEIGIFCQRSSGDLGNDCGILAIGISVLGLGL